MTGKLLESWEKGTATGFPKWKYHKDIVSLGFFENTSVASCYTCCSQPMRFFCMQCKHHQEKWDEPFVLSSSWKAQKMWTWKQLCQQSMDIFPFKPFQIIPAPFCLVVDHERHEDELWSLVVSISFRSISSGFVVSFIHRCLVRHGFASVLMGLWQ